MQKLNANSEFVVKENVVMFIILGVLFFGVFAGSVIFNNPPGTGSFEYDVTYLSMVPSIYFFIKALGKKKTFLRINRHGIFYLGELITSWYHFIDGMVTQEEKVISIQDNFILMLRYRNDAGKVFNLKIPLGNTQDKSEEEIIAAIKFFSKAGNRQ